MRYFILFIAFNGSWFEKEYDLFCIPGFFKEGYHAEFG